MDREEFNSMLLARIRELNMTYSLIEPGDLIAVAVSGGKDSVLTLHALAELRDELDFDLVAVTVDEGITGYRANGIKAARENANKMGVDLIEKSFKDEFSFTLDEVTEPFKSPCIPCGVFRRHILNKTAYELGASKIATGHNMDDEIQSFLMSLARGDTRKFSKFGPVLKRIHPKLVPRIKPLWSTPEKEVTRWVLLNEAKVHSQECPYSELSMRSRVKKFLNLAESTKPGVKAGIMRSFIKTFRSLKQEGDLLDCRYCGQPGSGDVCKACEFIKIIESQ